MQTIKPSVLSEWVEDMIAKISYSLISLNFYERLSSKYKILSSLPVEDEKRRVQIMNRGVEAFSYFKI